MARSETMERLGFDLCKGNGRFLPTQNGTADIAMDAALQTVANVQTPALFATYYSPEIVEILQAPRNSTEIFSEEKRGDWKDVQTMFPAVEYVGQTTAYSDYGRGLLSEANIEQVTRETYKFQTFIQIGDLEEDIATAQKINLLSEKQRAAATAIEIDANNYNLFGVAGMSIYGLLNDPALPAALSSATVRTDKTASADKDANEIYNDILSMFNQIAAASNGYVTFNSKLKLVVPPSIMGQLAKTTTLGVAPVLQTLKGFFPGLEIISLPQLQDDTGVCKAMLIATDIAGKPTAKFGFLEKLKTYPVLVEHSSMSQKWASSTTGCLLFRPFAVATMTGIQKS